MHATSLTFNDWEEIMQPALPPLFNQLGIVKTWNRQLLYSPANYNGLNIQHPYFRQHILQLETLISEGLHISPTRYLIQGTTELLRYETGCPGRITEIPLPILQLATPSWIRSLTQFAIDSNLQLQDPFPTPTLP